VHDCPTLLEGLHFLLIEKLFSTKRVGLFPRIDRNSFATENHMDSRDKTKSFLILNQININLFSQHIRYSQILLS
jgi:hypothetical protein